MKKLLLIGFLLVLCFALIGCDSNKPGTIVITNASASIQYYSQRFYLYKTNTSTNLADELANQLCYQGSSITFTNVPTGIPLWVETGSGGMWRTDKFTLEPGQKITFT